MDNKQIKIGLIGNTGVGKGTFVEICVESYKHLKILNAKLADPLYEAQNQIYKICNVDKDFYSQDGILLNFLGQHMRSINPNILKDYMYKRLEESLNVDLLFCDDIRPLDIGFMKSYGFLIIKIVADEDITYERRKLRGDLTMGNAKHKTERGLEDAEFDYVVENNGTLEEYKNKVVSLLKDLI